MKWLRKLFERKEFKRYGFHLVKFQLPVDGEVEFAQWEHKDEKPIQLTQPIVDFYRQFVKPGDFVLDIGTHIGDTTVPMALAAGPNGLTIGLEPNPHLFHVIEANAGLNKTKTNIIALPFAATAEDGEYTFASGDVSFNNGGIVGFSSNIKKNIRYTFKVQGRNIERYLNHTYPDMVKKLSLIKIDTEGYDKEIIKTMPNLIKNYKPVIITECFKQLTLAERTELYQLISQHQYDLYFIDEFLTGRHQTKIGPNDLMLRKHFDLIAIPVK